MTKISLVLVAALSFTALGCKKKGDGGDCGAAIAHSMDLSKADMAKMPGIDDKMIEKMRAMGVQHCTDDKWAPEAVTCMRDAKTETDAQSCYGKLTADQRDKMTKAATEVMTPPGAAAGSSGAPASAPPAAGSDTGAAGAAAPAAGSAAPSAGSDMAGSAAGSAAAPK